jgi:hypothetical protein
VVKLTTVIERVGFVARQFALWVIPTIWWEAVNEPDIGTESMQVSFLCVCGRSCGGGVGFATAVAK